MGWSPSCRPACHRWIRPANLTTPRRVNLKQIEVFKAVIEHGTVSSAAAALNVSQPAMSKSIAQLEADCEIRLFDRVKGRLAPTEQGMQLYDEIYRIFSGVQQVENAIDALHRQAQGRLLIGVMPGLSGGFVQRVTLLHGSADSCGAAISLCYYGRRTYSGRPSSGIRFSAFTAIATSLARR
jgi:molybdenum-dependent DNA-binding transcriptional regulator ModE